MLRVSTLALAVVLLSAAARAQSSDHVEVFAGYSYVSNDFSLSSQSGMQGWNAASTANFLPHLGVTADFSGLYPNAKVYTFLFGPQVSFRMHRVMPFAHVLFGDAIVHYNGYLSSDSSAAYAAGGGVDVGITPRIALRGQVDWLHNNFHTLDSQGGSRFYPNVARLSTGVVFRF
jgi:opacity protein-like surface antigen